MTAAAVHHRRLFDRALAIERNRLLVVLVHKTADIDPCLIVNRFFVFLFDLD